MARNLKYQFKTCIDNSFKEGMSKRSIKRNKANKNINTKTYSYADRKNLTDVSANFSNWMKDNNPKIKQIKDVTLDHVQNFLNAKADDGCSADTIKQYKSIMGKIGDLANNYYSSANVDFKSTVVPSTQEQTKIRNIDMSEEDYNKLVNKISQGQSQAYKAVVMAHAAGLRVAECAKIQQRDIKDNGNGTVTVFVADGKGGRDRNVLVTNIHDAKNLLDLRDSVFSPMDRIVPIQYGSINKAINRAISNMDGMQKYTDAKTSIHSIRKNYAQRNYDSLKEQGLNSKEAWGKTCVNLGHSADRMDLFKTYISRP